jgi:hypothetical protein
MRAFALPKRREEKTRKKRRRAAAGERGEEKIHLRTCTV